ncbi:MAG TPA: ribonuclease PH [Acidobacteriota bacterium]|nr:ribonuclease PH [Acidobacteriota bacterium]
MRASGRNYDAMREVRVDMDYTKHAHGSVQISVGDTRVLCTCSVEDRVPPFLNNMNQGWITAEYGMLPGATSSRSAREAVRGRQSGRTVEIQRLIGRSLRSVVNPSLLGTRTFLVDCDVIQADGGTRTASITGGFLALVSAFIKLMNKKLLPVSPLRDYVAAISVGMVNGAACLDLDYREDFKAEVDMNLVMTGQGRYVEIQGTAEKTPFTPEQLHQLQILGTEGIRRLIRIQASMLEQRADLKNLFPQLPQPADSQ